MWADVPVFFILVLAAYTLGHYLLYLRISRALGLARRGRITVAIVLACAAVLSLMAEVPGRAPFVLAGMAWFGVLAIAVSTFLIESAVAFLLPDHRRTIGIVALCAIPLVAGYALYRGTRLPVLKEVTVALPNLPASQSGWTMVQLSDLHLNRHWSPTRLCAIADDVNRLSPRLVAITGDLTDADVSGNEALCGCLRRLSARQPTVVVPGNHDYYAGYTSFLNTARCGGITVLNNARQIVDGVTVAGIDEPAGRAFTQGGPDLDKALGGRDRTTPTLLLAHRPEGFARAARKGIDLQLSGHTHAGQIPPLDLLIWLIYPHSYGYFEEAGSRIYTTSGTGTWGPPMRLFSRNEMVRITLVRRAPQ